MYSLSVSKSSAIIYLIIRKKLYRNITTIDITTNLIFSTAFSFLIRSSSSLTIGGEGGAGTGEGGAGKGESGTGRVVSSSSLLLSC